LGWRVVGARLPLGFSRKVAINDLGGRNFKTFGLLCAADVLLNDKIAPL
jgi:hypothetical protein